jgi:hypothetical protein
VLVVGAVLAGNRERSRHVEGEITSEIAVARPPTLPPPALSLTYDRE